MAYRLRYCVEVDWVGPGAGPMSGSLTPMTGILGNAGGAQMLSLQGTQQNIIGTGTGGAITSTEITTLTNAVASALSTQMNLAANLATMQGFATGNP